MIALAALLLAAPIAADVSKHIDGDKPGPRPAWAGPSSQLKSSPIHSFELGACGVHNARAIDNLVAFLRTHPKMEYALALVPGSSEAACHHCSWTRKDDPHWVEPNYRSRLRHAFLLLYEGVVHTLVISGGSIDPQHPEYNEAVFGFRELISEYGGRWPKNADGSHDKLEDRIIVDPWAIHSEVNVRNADRLTRLLGLERNLIVTEVGSIKRQGWYFVHHTAPLAFDHRASGQFGFSLGEFGELGGVPVFQRYDKRSQVDSKGVHPAQYTGTGGGHPDFDYIPHGVDTAAIAHWQLRSLNELMDGGGQHWDLGKNEIAENLSKDPHWKPLMPDSAKVGHSCTSLKRH
jgi:hypothetical protein